MDSSDESSAAAAELHAHIAGNESRTSASSLLLLTCSVKLDKGNYLLWRSMVLPIIKGYSLGGHITDLTSCPLEFLSEDAGNKINPAFEEWIAADQLLLAWFYSIMTVDMASQMLNCNTSKELWKAAEDLSKVYAKSRIPLYTNELRHARKGTMTMEEYLARMKTISDNLDFAGRPLSLDDLIARTLSGLGAYYDTTAFTLIEKKNLTWIDFLALLLTFENQLQPSNGGRSYRDESELTCQICRGYGNNGANCYFRYDRNYMG